VSPNYSIGGSVFLLYNLLDGLIANYFPILDKIDNKLKTIEERIFSATKPTSAK